VDQVFEFIIGRLVQPVSLGKISDLHITFADKFGSDSKECLELAKLHSQSVDSTKTGKNIDQNAIAHFTKKLNEMGGYGHFLERDTNPQNHSTGILGKMYDRILLEIKKYENKLDDKGPIKPDPDLDRKGKENFIADAIKKKEQYNKEISRIMRKFEIFEIDKAEKDRRIKDLCVDLKQSFYDKETLSNNSIDTLYDKASAWYWVCYGGTKTNKDGKPDNYHLSFAWVVADVLNQMKSNKLMMTKLGRLARTVGPLLDDFLIKTH